jgi:hypothetical protein
MTDWDQLREVGHQVSPPPFDTLVSKARQRDRRGRIVTGGAALAVVGTLGIALLMANDGGGNAQPVKDPSDPVSTDQVALPEGVLPLPAPDQADEITITEPGRYRVPLSDTRSFDVDLPQGTGVSGDGLYTALGSTTLKTELAGESYGVPADPCHSYRDVQPAGPTVDDLVSAIRNEPAYRVSLPEAVEIDGAAGQYLEIRLPAEYDVSTCTENQLGLPGNVGSNNNMEPGYVGRWWILDVEGERTVLQAFCAQCEAPTPEEVTDMVEGISFTSTS